MKTKLLTLVFLCAITFISAQNNTNNKIDNINYIVGAEKIKEYSIETKTYNASNLNIDVTNGAPILQAYFLTKDKYIGGVLEGHNKNKTKITDIKFIRKENKEVQFIVVGKDFSEELTTRNGLILKDSEDYTVFYTDKVGIWKINKKK